MSVVLSIDSGRGPRDVRLDDYLDAAAMEACEEAAIAWIKSLRLAIVEGRSFRARFRYRDESLWWFAELYLHKRGAILSALKYVHAIETLLAREQPLSIDVQQGDAIARLLVVQAASRLGLTTTSALTEPGTLPTRLRDEARGAFYAWSAFLSHLRPRGAPEPPATGVRVAAFVHSAFWRHSDRGGEESYIGPVLQAISARLGPGELQLVGVGPRTNFRVRRWWHRLSEFSHQPDALPFTPIDVFADRAAVEGSQALWHERDMNRRACWSSDDVKRACLVRGYDLWPIVRQELAGVCELQFPWSARSMDEAGAALDALRPAVVVTYAEAGGWGRALMLEARARGIPSVGVQHGFIYRHWLNYRHEPDELVSAVSLHDDGFPRPTKTLLFDRFAEAHLLEYGRFPPTALAVTGSPRLDELARAVEQLTPGDLQQVRRRAGAPAGAPLVLVASKFTQLARWWQPLVEAVKTLRDVHVAVKCHPAESPEPYTRSAEGVANLTIVPAGADLASLVAAASVVVTVNSTVAVDAMVLGVPSLVIGSPSNLSPFVEAGAMAGASTAAHIGTELAGLLYDGERRARIAQASRAVMTQYAIGTDGHAARRAADEILTLAAGLP